MSDELLQALKDIEHVARTRRLLQKLPSETPDVLLQFIWYIATDVIERHEESQDGTAD